MQRSQILLTITLSIFSSLGVALLGPVYAIFIVNRFSASIIDVGILSAIFSFVAAIFKIPAGRLTDLYGKEKIFIIGIFAGALCSLSYIVASNLLQLYIIEFFFGLSVALQRPALLALTIDMSDKGNRGLFLGIFESANDIALASAALLSVVIVGKFGFEPLFLLCSSCQATTGLFVLNKQMRIHELVDLAGSS